MKNLIVRNTSKAILFLVFALFLASCSRNPVTGKREIMLVSESQEQAMGLESDPAIIANYGLYDDQKMQDFINQKGKMMGKISHRPDIEYKFRILDSPVVNAFAVPGGYVYFTRGIMAHFNSEAEFAGVLGHEIGHITARHSASQLSKQQLLSVGMIAGMIVKPEFAKFSDMAQQGLGLLFLKFGRDDESQSDMLGVDYSSQIGYDSHEMADFFEVLGRLQAQSGQSIPDFMSTHPNPVNRYAKVHQMSDEWQTQNKGAFSGLKVNRNEYLKMIDGIVFGEDPRQGYVEDYAFNHPELKFQFPVPTNWQVVNTPQMVQIGEKQGKAIMLMTLAQEKNLDDAARAAIQRDQLQVVESSKTTVNGLPAIAMISEQIQGQRGQQQGQQQNSIRILTYLIQYNGLIYKLHGMSLKQDFNTFFNTFQNTMTGFRKLTDPNKLNRKPDIIRIKTVTQDMTFGQAMSQFRVPNNKVEDYAILNNMQSTEQLKAGALVKIIERGTGSTSSSSNNSNSNTSSNSSKKAPTNAVDTKKPNQTQTQPTNQPTNSDKKRPSWMDKKKKKKGN